MNSALPLSNKLTRPTMAGNFISIRTPRRRMIFRLLLLLIICYLSFHTVYYHILHLGQCNKHHHMVKWSKCSLDRSFKQMPANLKSNSRGDRIALVSICQGKTDLDRKLCALAMDNHLHYGRFHAYLLRGKYGVSEKVIPFGKISRIKNVLSRDPIEWVIYMNYNNYFLDFSVPASRFISNLPTSTELVISESEEGVSTGGFILRNSRWSITFLNVLYEKMKTIQSARAYSEVEERRLDEIALRMLLKEKPEFFQDKVVRLSECIFIGNAFSEDEAENHEGDVHFHGDFAVSFKAPDPNNPYTYSVYFESFAKKLKQMQNSYILGTMS